MIYLPPTDNVNISAPLFLSKKNAFNFGCLKDCEIKNEKTIFVPDWGIELTVSKKVPIETKYVAIRAHNFAQDEKQNRQKIRIVDFIEQPFENQIRFVFDKQKNNSNSICWFVDKQLSDINQTKEVGINPNDVLLLK